MRRFLRLHLKGEISKKEDEEITKNIITFTHLKRYGIIYLILSLCISFLPHFARAASTPEVNNLNSTPLATWTIHSFNNLNLAGIPLKTTSITTSASPIKYTYPNTDPTQIKPFQSVRSTTNTSIQSGKYYLNVEYVGKIAIYIDNKLIIQEESLLSSKKIKKSILISERLNQPTSRDIHTIRLEHSNFQNNPILTLSLNPIQQAVDLNQKDIAYNWGYSAPLGYTSDLFNLTFINTTNYLTNDYFASLYTTDQTSIHFDDKKILESNPTSNNMLNNAVIENVLEGEHTVTTNFTDLNGGEASLFSTIVPFSNWVAYYFNNTSSTGLPVARQTLANQSSNVLLRASNETNSPVPGIVAKNYYGVRYIMYKRMTAGTYQLEYKSGEGVGVWLDGKQIAYDWKDGKKSLRKISFQISDNTLNSTSKDIHQITVRTYNRKSPQNMLVSIAPTVISPVSQIKTVVIDAGHGGKDTGAIGIGGLKEKDIVLDVSKKVESLFKEMTPYKIYLTRTNDTFIPLGQRPAFAIAKKADAFVSIHANSGSSSASGLETYYYGIKPSSTSMNKMVSPTGPNNSSFFSKESSILGNLETSASNTNPYITDSKLLASFIQKRMVTAFQLPDRGSKHGNFQVIRANKLPAVLTELGFVTNKNDASKLSSPYWRQIAAEAIYMGILDFFENKGSDVTSFRIY